MRNKIELLREALIDEHKDVALDILGYASKLGIVLGWHYLLDIIWILKELNVHKGKTILDAGAGNGVLQYILASKGYNVISADVNPRERPLYATNMYNIEFMGTETYISHPFLEWHRAEKKEAQDNNVIIHQSTLPTITLYQCELRNMGLLRNDSIDAVVSVSALEHNPPENIGAILSEFQRVLKKGSTMLLTVSASLDSYFHEPSCSWVLHEDDVRTYYNLGSNIESNFHMYNDIFGKLCTSKRLHNWMASVYYRKEKNGMPWGRWNPQYQPVGILKINE